ncbi:uncharacterized protein B0I36DRAFT_310259 [Microdochium trichocladiopsis]|uniref:Uncharacterized protein n=1 Tax=Microdochium trichocladiopsis TaxID=1682393 RepID=A0A9P9BW49_9PEZI|nr:uncharacterized protein B0I36DRAFT_310259 [Microdochium trichocladiopsis]KAH7040245.1 hypothetical protein B0I36DRAFT_310259 [Microdochium trichocladiopsis]
MSCTAHSESVCEGYGPASESGCLTLLLRRWTPSGCRFVQLNPTSRRRYLHSRLAMFQLRKVMYVDETETRCDGACCYFRAAQRQPSCRPGGGSLCLELMGSGRPALRPRSNHGHSWGAAVSVWPVMWRWSRREARDIVDLDHAVWRMRPGATSHREETAGLKLGSSRSSWRVPSEEDGDASRKAAEARDMCVWEGLPAPVQ